METRGLLLLVSKNRYGRAVVKPLIRLGRLKAAEAVAPRVEAKTDPKKASEKANRGGCRMTDNTVQEAFDDLLFHVICSVKYHSRRRRFYESVNNSALFCAFLFSTATMASLLAASDGTSGFLAHLEELPAIVTSILIGITLVGRVGAKANDHNDRKRRFIRLQQDMERSRAAMDEMKIAGWREKRLQIEMDEPPINRVVHAQCYNEVVKSLKDMSNTEKKYVKIGFRHRAFGWITRAFDDSLKVEPPKSADAY